MVFISTVHVQLLTENESIPRENRAPACYKNKINLHLSYLGRPCVYYYVPSVCVFVIVYRHHARTSTVPYMTI